MSDKKERSIIEKLWITPGPWVNEHNPHLGHHVFESGKSVPVASHISRNDIGLIASAPEMLGALIDSLLLLERYEKKQVNNNGIGTMTDNVPQRYHKIKETVEKATSKSWEEIKELL